MRFTIHQLMLLPVVFILNTFLVWVFAVGGLRSFRWSHETNSVTHAQEWVESAVRFSGYANIEVTDVELNDWICHRLSVDHPAAGVLMDPPRPDAWGNPYRFQPRKSLNERPRVYSAGEDGLSNTNGNDPDDIRSWDETRCRWYAQRQFTRDMSYCMMVSALITLVGFWLFTFNPKRTPNEAQSQG